RADVIGLDEGVVLAAQQVLEQNLHRVRQPRDAAEAGAFERGEAVDLNCLSARADVRAGIEAVVGWRHTNPRSYFARQLITNAAGISFATVERGGVRHGPEQERPGSAAEAEPAAEPGEAAGLAGRQSELEPVKAAARPARLACQGARRTVGRHR